MKHPIYYLNKICAEIHLYKNTKFVRYEIQRVLTSTNIYSAYILTFADFLVQVTRILYIQKFKHICTFTFSDILIANISLLKNTQFKHTISDTNYT